VLVQVRSDGRLRQGRGSHTEQHPGRRLHPGRLRLAQRPERPGAPGEQGQLGRAAEQLGRRAQRSGAPGLARAQPHQPCGRQRGAEAYGQLYGLGRRCVPSYSQPTVPLPRRRSSLLLVRVRRDWRGELGDHDTSALARDGAEGLGGGHGWALPCRHALTLEVRLCLPPSESVLVAHRLVGVCSGQTVGQQGSGGAGAPAPRPAPKYNNTGWRPN